MKLVANGLNGQYLRSFLPPDGADIERVFAAIAYGADDQGDQQNDLLGKCIYNKWRLDIWMRYDSTVPVAVPLLERLYKSLCHNVFCRLVPNILHSKVIWWKGYGAYIGSANFTARAWNSNIEAGLFLDESELISTGVDTQLAEFFDELAARPKSYPLNEQIIEEMRRMSVLKRPIPPHTGLLLPHQEGLSFVSVNSTSERRRENFLEEWGEGLAILKMIADKVVDHRPSWVDRDAPSAWQADQFLHAYYYNRVVDGNSNAYEAVHLQNRGSPMEALGKELKWWSRLSEPPSNENYTFDESAPYLRECLTRDNVKLLSLEELEMVCNYTHATLNHIMKLPASFLGATTSGVVNRETRVQLYSKWLFEQKNELGWGVGKLLYFVFYDGDDELIPNRLYQAAFDPALKIPHYGLNSMAELVGWVRPDVVPPRNGRTSKALRGLGYPVRVH